MGGKNLLTSLQGALCALGQGKQYSCPPVGQQGGRRRRKRLRAPEENFGKYIELQDRRMRREGSAIGICTAIWIAISAALTMTGCSAGSGDQEGNLSQEDSSVTQGQEGSQDSAVRGQEGLQGSSAAQGQEGSQESSPTGEGNSGEEDPEEKEAGEASPEAGQNPSEESNLTFRLTGGPSGLPEEIQEQIAQINKGIPPSDVLGETVPEGYYALVATYTVTAQDKETGEESTGNGRLTLYVPNLVEGLEDVTILCYDNVSGQWKLLPVESMNTEKKTLSVMLTGSATLTVIYRRQE